MDASCCEKLSITLDAENNWVASGIFIGVYTSLEAASSVPLDLAYTLHSTDEGVQNLSYDDLVWKAHWLSSQFSNESDETKTQLRAYVYTARKKAEEHHKGTLSSEPLTIEA
jgi:hypothetical protein